jgi:hypothetical protein
MISAAPYRITERPRNRAPEEIWEDAWPKF